MKKSVSVDHPHLNMASPESRIELMPAEITERKLRCREFKPAVQKQVIQNFSALV